MTTHAGGTGLLRTKPVDDVLEQGEGKGSGLRKRLGVLDLTGFGVGIVIGTGIFTLTGVEAKDSAGPAVVVSFVIAGIVALLAALCYAELASAVPTAGSAYSYAYATIGEIVAWIIGWDLLLEFVLGSSVVARGWSGYLQNLFDLPTAVFGEDSTVNLGAVAIVAVLAVVAITGIKQSAWLTNVLVVVKVAICLFVIVAGAFFLRSDNLRPFVPPAGPADSESGLAQPVVQALFGAPSSFGVAGVVSAAAVVFFAYTGFEAVANLSEETERPARDMPRGLIATLVVATVLYVGVSFVLTGMQRYTRLNAGSPLASAFDSVGASWAGTLVSIAAVCGLTSVILVELVGLGRIGFAMGRDRLLPEAVAKVEPRTGTPVRFTVLVAAMIMIIGGLVPLADLADLVSIGALSAFTIVSVAVPLLRHTRPELERPFRVPFSPVLPVVSALACLYLSLNLSVETWLRFAVWLAIGMVVYFGYGRRHARLRTRTRT
ncbi:basic amino acid/polyamine antiporter, APA family [Jatrophihabitans endophyticus]|uniref:Basic amino acid/polyamine antiporter, APA family n=1 Tax=Jatrophihabitans endophyticus TaxID=1206085 RepID=A0A1M5T333_9ACTN|nr:amino acid permease [Jatrophihabitans endophyticus]SHH45020.1 basic amino acid/polyamine antiporter, APA family [Jatrophihabitans endophyticus]